MKKFPEDDVAPRTVLAAGAKARARSLKWTHQHAVINPVLQAGRDAPWWRATKNCMLSYDRHGLMLSPDGKRPRPDSPVGVQYPLAMLT